MEGLVTENAELKKKLEKVEVRQLADLSGRLLGKAVAVNGVSFIGEIVEVSNADALKKLCFDLKSGLSALPGTPPYMVVLASNIEGKAAVAVLLDDQLVESVWAEASGYHQGADCLADQRWRRRTKDPGYRRRRMPATCRW